MDTTTGRTSLPKLGKTIACYDGSINNLDVLIAISIASILIAVITICFLDCTKNHEDKTDTRFYWWPIFVLIPVYLTTPLVPLAILWFQYSDSSSNPCFMEGPPVLMPLIFGLII